MRGIDQSEPFMMTSLIQWPDTLKPGPLVVEDWYTSPVTDSDDENADLTNNQIRVKLWEYITYTANSTTYPLPISCKVPPNQTDLLNTVGESTFGYGYQVFHYALGLPTYNSTSINAEASTFLVPGNTTASLCKSLFHYVPCYKHIDMQYFPQNECDPLLNFRQNGDGYYRRVFTLDGTSKGPEDKRVFTNGNATFNPFTTTLGLTGTTRWFDMVIDHPHIQGYDGPGVQALLYLDSAVLPTPLGTQWRYYAAADYTTSPGVTKTGEMATLDTAPGTITFYIPNIIPDAPVILRHHINNTGFLSKTKWQTDDSGNKLLMLKTNNPVNIYQQNMYLKQGTISGGFQRLNFLVEDAAKHQFIRFITLGPKL